MLLANSLAPEYYRHHQQLKGFTCSAPVPGASLTSWRWRKTSRCPWSIRSQPASGTCKNKCASTSRSLAPAGCWPNCRSGPIQQFRKENLPRKRPRFSLNSCVIIRTSRSGIWQLRPWRSPSVKPITRRSRNLTDWKRAEESQDVKL